MVLKIYNPRLSPGIQFGSTSGSGGESEEENVALREDGSNELREDGFLCLRED